MAITNAQQYKQLVNPPMKGNKRPGYRGPGGYQGGRKDTAPGAAKAGPVERGGGNGGNKFTEFTKENLNPQKDTFTQAYKAPGLFGIGGGYRDLNVAGDTSKGFKQGIGSRILGGLLGLINPVLGFGYRAIAGTPGALDKFQSSKTLEEFRDRMRGYGRTMPTIFDNPNFDQMINKDDEEEENKIIIDDDMSLPIIPRISESDMSLLTPEQKRLIGLQNRFNFDDGGMIGGGIMDAAGRQQYFLGKLVKKAKRAVKKIVKSPVGKLGLGALALKFGLPAGAKSGIMDFLFKKGTLGSGLTGGGMLALGGALSAAPLLFQKEEEQGEGLGTTGSVGGQIDPRAYTDPYGVLFGAFKAEGGSMKDEPVAKRTMPLLDMGGQEMDLRAEGGFVPIGRMEKADDVPARLSKNEFVFTAEAVRNAGDGDVDKGAEVMYNMMKNLESGGDVSEESQGLEGARNMFQTSKRLEEVI